MSVEMQGRCHVVIVVSMCDGGSGHRMLVVMKGLLVAVVGGHCCGWWWLRSKVFVTCVMFLENTAYVAQYTYRSNHLHKYLM